MYTKNNRNHWTLFLFLLAGMVVGSFLAYYLKQYPFLAWLNFGQPLGITTPATLSAGILSVTIGFEIRISIGSVIGLILGAVAYRLSAHL